MKANQVKPAPEPRQELTCLQCGRKMEHTYGMWGDGGTCSRLCEEHYEMRQQSIFAQGGYDDDLDDDA